jgi:acyl phosphate:glycerol-3-phosphate acyltransferase
LSSIYLYGKAPWLLPLFAYLLGSIPFAVPISALFGLPSPYSYGSGNPGATNVMRSGGIKGKCASILTLLLDALKGVAIVLLAKAIQAPPLLFTAALLAVFMGHLFPVFFRFKGGKGVATAAGLLWALNWKLGGAVTATWLCLFLVFHISSLAALGAASIAPFIAALIWAKDLRTAAVIVMSAFLLWRHRSNIQLLISGNERPFK